MARTLAEERRAAIESLSYDLSFTVPAVKSERVSGRNLITVRLRQSGRPLVLDFAEPPESIKSLDVNGQALEPDARNGHIIIPATTLTPGDNRLDVSFLAGDGPLNRGDEFLYTLFVPARANRAFPCFDQPDLKTRVRLSLDLPGDWQAVANGPEISRLESASRRLMRFAETPPLSTYLIAFAAGRLQVETAQRNGRTFRMFHRETDAAKLARNREAVFDLHAQAVAWLEEYTGIPYPWGKLDFFLVPAFQFGGMEHAAAIYYNAPALLLDESATQAQLLNRASLIAHETAHMWFGDLVTMRWFDDVWLKEVLANFFAAKMVNPAFPEIDHELRFFLAHYPGAYEVDRTAGTHPIRQPLDNLDQAGTLYGAIIYLKSPIVMRQIERLLGERTFREGMREYLRTYSFENASWTELIGVLDKRVDDDLLAWSRVWVEGAGRPVVRTELQLEQDGRVKSLAFVQTDPVGRGRIWPQTIDVLSNSGEGTKTFTVRLNATRVEVPGARGLPSPRFVLPTAGGLGYGDFVVDTATRETLLAVTPDLSEGLTRGAVYVTLWEDLEQGRLQAQRFLEFALRALERENDEQNLSRLLSYTAIAYWRFLGDERALLTADLERTLRGGLQRAGTRTAKAAWFHGLVRVAGGEATLRWLEQVWRREEKIEGLPLAEPDETTLAQELAVRQVGSWKEILSVQQERIDNPDRKERFAFVRAALDADPEVRDRFFATLADVANRRHEPWVIEALDYLHHPLRAARSERYVRPSLDLLEEIRRTGDIFFPKRWLDATLGGHRSRSVAETVKAFLETHPDYPPRLRRIILQSADELFRVSAPF